MNTINTSEHIVGTSEQSGTHAGCPVYGTLLALLIITAAATCAYWNSFSGAFMFDDIPIVVNNAKLRNITDNPSDLLLRMRPVANITFAGNVAFSRTDTWGYHAVNFAVHLLAAWTLFGVVRRTLRTARLRDRFGNAATILACIIATIWAVHPLATEAVTYIVQRDESLMGLFYLLTLYCVIRAADAKHAAAWSVMAVAACLLGMGTKQVMITAPLFVLIYDRMFLSDSFGGMLRKRWPLYLGLFATWGVIATMLLTQPVGPTVGGGIPITWWQYASTQPGVICKYLELTFWPTNLCLDYWWPPAIVPDKTQTMWNIVPYAVVVAAMFATIVWGLCKRSGLAFLGACFFLILAPTSTVLPIADYITDRRMYLPLAAVVAFAVVLGYMAIGWTAEKITARRSGVLPAVFGLMVAAGLVATLAYLTGQRNTAYYSERIMWEEILATRPENPRAMLMVGFFYMKDGDLDRAEEYYKRSLNVQVTQRYRATMAETFNYIGVINFRRGEANYDNAMEYYEKALKQRADYPDPLSNIGLIYFERKQYNQAAAYYQKALACDPLRSDLEEKLGRALVLDGRRSEAIEHFRKVVQIEPTYAAGYVLLGETLRREDNNEEAIACFIRALQYDESNFEACEKLGQAYVAQGRLVEAANAYARAATLNPDNFIVQMELGRLYDMQDRLKEALEAFGRAAVLKPDDDGAQLWMGRTLGALGRMDECLDHLHKATVLAPKSAIAHYQFGRALVVKKQKAKAAEEFRIALSLDPKNAEIRAALEQVAGKDTATQPATTPN